MPRDTYVRIGEAARLVGKSVDTLRRWEAEGRLFPAARSLGGQRIYLLAEIQRLVDDEDSHASGQAHELTSRRRPAPGAVPPREVREASAAADPSVTKLRPDRRQEVRRSAEEQRR